MIYVTERGDAGLHMGEVLRKASWTKPMILITKSPQLVIPHLDKLDKLHPYGNNKGYMVHCTITGYGGTALEPGVRPPNEMLRAYNKLISKIGPERTVLRIDPIIPTEKGLEVAYEILSKARGRVRISFFDAYPHALQRMTPKMRETIASVYNGNFHAPLELRLSAFNAMKAIKNDIEVCGEPGLPCYGCVSKRDIDAMGMSGDINTGRKNQRAACSCIAEKAELLSSRGQCGHGCLYCFWK